MKFLFGYKPGKVISEQNTPLMEFDLEMDDEYDVDFADPDVAPSPSREKEKERERTAPDTDPFPNPFDPGRSKEFNPLPDLQPQGKDRFSDDDENEPFTDEVESDEVESDGASRDLEQLVAKYLKGKN